MTDLNTPVVDEAMLSEIVGFVWQTFVGGDPDETGFDGGEPPAALPFPNGPSATISIGGEWTATLIVTMAQPLVERFASALLGQPAGELDRADVDDAFGELVNVVGGNVKGLVDDPTATLSLPTVSPVKSTVAGGHLAVQTALVIEGLPMIWELWERA